MWKYTKLANTLSGLYFRINDIVAFIQKAGFNPAVFVLDGSNANVVWVLMIRQIEQLGKIKELVDAALTDYPDNPVLVDYRNNADVIRADIYAGERPVWKDTRALPPKELEKIIRAQSTLLPISFLEVGMQKARSVARVVTPEGLGTGFLISGDNLFLTNNHVLNTKDLAGKSTVQFNYQKTIKGLPEQYAEFEIDNENYQTSVTDDWSLVKIKGDPAKTFGYLKPINTKVKKDDFVNIIQHPGGEYKQIGLYHNLVTYADENIIQYLTDTLPGSSGSPVFNSEWEVVALHHSGGWIEHPGTTQAILQNEGINMNKIRDTLSAKGFSL